MNENIGVVMNNKISGIQTVHLAQYLNHEDICSLNNVDVLEEILKNVENSVMHHDSLAGKLVELFSSRSSVFFSLISEKSGEIYDSFKKLTTSVISKPYLSRISLKLRIATVLPAFFIFTSVFSPYGAFVRPVKINTPPCLEALNSFTKPGTIENKAVFHTVGNTYKVEKIISACSNNKVTLVPENSAKAKNAAIPSGKNSNANIKTQTPASAKNNSVVQHENIISRSAGDRTGLPDTIKSYKKKLTMRATAYDLSVKSCSKPPSHPAYGITKSGTRATVGRTIAVDPRVIPLKSRVYIVFPAAYKQLDGVYIAEDTGSLIKGNEIDVFFGEDKPGELIINNKANKFGVQTVEVYILD